MSGFKQLVGSGGIGVASKNNFPPKIFNNNLLVVSSNSWKVALFWQHHKLIAHLKSLIAIYYWFQRETDKMRSSKWQNLC